MRRASRVGAGLALSQIFFVAWGAVFAVPPSLSPGDYYRLAFVTEDPYSPAGTTIAGLNTSVTSDVTGTLLATALTAASLSPTWYAIASTSDVDARDNTGTASDLVDSYPIYLLNGSCIATGNSDLWDGALAVPLNVDPNGVTLSSSDSFVWTGTGAGGTHAVEGVNHYPLGGASDARMAYGYSSDSDMFWAFGGTATPEGALPHGADRLYAVSSPLMVPVPEVNGLVQATILGMAGFAGLCWRRRRTSRPSSPTTATSPPTSP